MAVKTVFDSDDDYDRGGDIQSHEPEAGPSSESVAASVKRSRRGNLNSRGRYVESGDEVVENTDVKTQTRRYPKRSQNNTSGNTAAANRSKRSATKKAGSDIINAGENKELHEEGIGEIEDHLSKANKGLGLLRKKIKALQDENVELRTRLDNLLENENVSIQPKRGKKGGETMESLQFKVKKLNDDVTRLEQARAKDKKKLAKLRNKEIEADAADLQGGLDSGAGFGDTTDRMRKLLRRFYNLMTAPSLEEGEECGICLTEMKPSEAVSLVQCQHVVCRDCLPNINPPICPHCRQPIGDETESVEYTATEQWDSLLEVAQDWARLDTHGDSEPEETEEEEVPFIDDGEGDDKSLGPEVSEAEDNQSGDGNDDEQDEAAAIEDPPTHASDDNEATSNSNLQLPQPQSPSYQSSPTTEKRKRLESLAERRRLKKFR